MAQGAPLSAAEAFAARAGRAVDPVLEASLHEALATCRAELPDVDADLVSFAAHLGQVASHRGGAVPGGPTLVDLYLAFAAANADPAAVARLEREVLPAAVAAIRALGASAAAADEGAQRVREKLLVGWSDGGDGRGPRLLGYRGQGRLAAWVRVIAVREELMAQRGRRAEVPLSDAMLAAMADPSDDPELAHIRHHYRTEMAGAVTVALAALTARERALLRYSLVDGLSLDQIGAVYRVHKSSVSRWLARARTRLWTTARGALKQRLGIDSGELDSIVRLLRSGLDLSLERLLDDSD